MLAFATACVTAMLDAAMEPRMLLHGYYKALLKAAKVQVDAFGVVQSARWWFMPLGGCTKCMNYWIGFIFYVPFCFEMGVSWWYSFFLFWLFSGVSFFFLTKIVEK